MPLEYLYERRQPLIAERNKILNARFLFMRPKLKSRLSIIDRHLDTIEIEIARLHKCRTHTTKYK